MQCFPKDNLTDTSRGNTNDVTYENVNVVLSEKNQIVIRELVLVSNYITRMMKQYSTKDTKFVIAKTVNKKSIKEDIIYPIISTKVDGQTINALIDSGSGSSHIRSKTIDKLDVEVKEQKNPLVINGFGNSTSQKIKLYATLKLTGNQNESITT